MPGQAVEVAITFDKSYTLKEIYQLIPQNLKLNWIWSGVKVSGLDTIYGFTPYFDKGLSYSEQKRMEKEIEKAYDKDKNADVTSIYQKYESNSKLKPQESLENTYTIFQGHLKEFLANKQGFATMTDEDGVEYSTEDLLKEFLGKK